MSSKTYFRNPAATASMIVEKNGSVYLVKRGNEPYFGMRALPGGFLECNQESLEETAVRELREETPFVAKKEDLELLCVNSDPNRDPRGHVIDHVYIVKKYITKPHKDGDYDDAIGGDFFPLDNLPPLAFDHGDVLKQYFKNSSGEVKR